MTKLPEEKAILALHRADDIAIYQRFLDRSTSGWRYRCGGTYSKETKNFDDYTALRKNNPAKVKRAIDRVTQLGGSGMSMARQDSFGPQEPGDHFLLFLGDLQRFLSVNALIVARYFREQAPGKVDFKRHAPIYNLIVALDFKDSADRVLTTELSYLQDAVSAPGFRDDKASNAAGSLRALADMTARRGDDDTQLKLLKLSQGLTATPGKAARIFRLLQNSGAKEEANEAMKLALLKWPDARNLKILASARQ